MIITCEKCNTSYLVAVESIGVQGRKVKCIKCNHMWSATLNNEQLVELKNKQAELEAAPNPEQNNLSIEEKAVETFAALPALIKPKASPFLKVTPILLSIILIMMAGIFGNDKIIKFFPSTATLYSNIGLFPSNGFIIDNVILKEQNKAFNISCIIKNTTNTHAYVPLLRVVITDQENNNITYKKIKTNHKLLAPGESYTSDINIDIPNNAAYIVMDLGNKWELFLRKLSYFINKNFTKSMNLL